MPLTSVPPFTWHAYVDWAFGSLQDFLAPDFSQGIDDITPYVKSVSISEGIQDPKALVANIGTCDLILNNADGRFSKYNSASPYYPNIRPKKPMKITVTRNAVTTTLFLGTMESIVLAPGSHSTREATMHCEDYFAGLQNNLISIPVLANVRSDTLFRHVINSSFSGQSAFDAFILYKTPLDGDTVTINGTVYTFKTALGVAANQVLIADRRAQTASNLAACVNAGDGAGTLYTSNSTRPSLVNAQNASAGATSTVVEDLPSRGTMWHADSTFTIGTPVTAVLAAQPFRTVTTTANNGDTFFQSFFVDYDGYGIHFCGQSGPNFGATDVYIDNIFIGNLDWYSASPAVNVVQLRGLTAGGKYGITASVPSGNGVHVLKVVTNGKNASSSGYNVSLTCMWVECGDTH